MVRQQFFKSAGATSPTAPPGPQRRLPLRAAARRQAAGPQRKEFSTGAAGPAHTARPGPCGTRGAGRQGAAQRWAAGAQATAAAAACRERICRWVHCCRMLLLQPRVLTNEGRRLSYGCCTFYWLRFWLACSIQCLFLDERGMNGNGHSTACSSHTVFTMLLPTPAGGLPQGPLPTGAAPGQVRPPLSYNAVPPPGHVPAGPAGQPPGIMGPGAPQQGEDRPQSIS